MPRASDPIKVDESPWHLLGATLRHWREDVRDLTQRELAKAAFVDQGELSRWERGLARPHADHVKGIDDALGACGQIAALHAIAIELDRFRAGTVDSDSFPSACDEVAVERRTLLQLLAMFGAGVNVPASAIDALHAGLRQAIGVAAENSVEDWEQVAWDYAQGVWTEPPGSRITDLAGDIRALEQRLSRTMEGPERAALLRVYAQLAAFMAMDLSHGAVRMCWRSWRAARSAADASGDRDLQVWVRAEEASESFYLHRAGPAAGDLVEDALRLANGRPSLGLTEALKISSRMHATVGQAEQARDALGALEHTFERLPPAVTRDRISVWGQSLDTVQFAEAYVLIKLGDTEQAMPLVEQALAACPREKVGGRANVRLLQAWTLVQDRDVNEGLGHALDIVSPLPVTAARRRLADEILDSLPEKAAALPAARDLRALTASRTNSPKGSAA
ncbi:XRE family transcriptional regulator [Sphaerisporangium album]|uniref:XRE family transcriptional regulator n=1 Tax=Sphaerisporangium album TaxID=509200 RepID=A0A367FHU9_9ACTN|nr:helix-turn-helix transcriptional regulator [Sphaerisporangium album]RCG29864.1 XRE family transcriptional regulator [Sphaerisporangium album]